MRAAIVVPRRAGDPDRDAAWRFTEPWWQRFGYPLYAVEHHGPDPFNRAWCINEGARRADEDGGWDVLIIIDSDTLEDTDDQVPRAVIRAWETGRFTVAHVQGRDLTAEGTKRILAGEETDWFANVVAMREVCDSRVNLIRRDTFEALGGYDTRFRGWGHEDVAFTAAVEMLVGPIERIPGTSWHLYHAPMLPKARPTREWKRGKTLANRYRAADLNGVRAILDERREDERYTPPESPPPRRFDAETQLVVLTSGRKDYLERTLASANEHLKGNIIERILFDDSGDRDYVAYLDATYGNVGWGVIHSSENLGFSKVMAVARSYIANTPGAPYVFWLEDDFTFDRDVKLDDMATLLDDPGLAQAALLRAPAYPREFAAGSIPNEHPESYTKATFHGIPHLRHSRFYTSNPNLSKRESFSIPWPEGMHTESRYGHLLVRKGYEFAFLGYGEPWIKHIGEVRGGFGY